MATSIRQRRFDIPFVALLAGAASACVSLIVVLAMRSRAGAAFFPLLACAALTLSCTAACAALHIRRKARDARAIEKTGKAGVLPGIVTLAESIADFSRGNITVQPESIEYREEEAFGASSELSALLAEVRRHTMDALDSLRSITSVPCKRLCYVGADSYKEGERCAKAMAGLLGNSGEVVVFINFLDIVSSTTRFKAFEKTLRQLAPGTKIVAVLEEHEDAELAYRRTSECLDAHPGLRGIYITDGSVPQAVARAVVDKGRSESVVVVSHDLTAETMEYVKKGVIRATLSQNPFVQGYNPIVYLYNYLVTRKPFTVNRLLTEIELVTPENFREYWDDREGMLLSKTGQASLAVPVANESGQAFKIGVVIPDDMRFWKAVSDGIKRATEVLGEYGVSVELLIPDETRKGDWSAETYGRAIQRLADSGCRAIAFPLFRKELVTLVNRLSDSGISFATLNAEPLSFRAIISAISEHTGRLFQASETLSSGAVESSATTSRISETMGNVLVANRRQKEVIQSTDSAADSLFANIAEVSGNAGESISAARDASRTALAGRGIVEASNEAIEALKRVTAGTTEVIERLSSQALKIRDILTITEDVADKTNLLALNASIEAAHAGAQGKGFAVVASEIRMLAEKSKGANSDIAGLVETVLSSVREAQSAVASSMATVGLNYELSGKVNAALEEIIAASARNEKANDSMTRVSKELGRLSDIVKNAMGELVKVNSENSDAIEEIAVSAKEISNESADISRTAQMLTEMARAEEELILQLIIE